ncbi:hypothetical protein SAURM35S_06255 [Streptomyces aurantiogriseus]
MFCVPPRAAGPSTVGAAASRSPAAPGGRSSPSPAPTSSCWPSRSTGPDRISSGAAGLPSRARASAPAGPPTARPTASCAHSAHLSTVTELLEHGRCTLAPGLRLYVLVASRSPDRRLAPLRPGPPQPTPAKRRRGPRHGRRPPGRLRLPGGLAQRPHHRRKHLRPRPDPHPEPRCPLPGARSSYASSAHSPHQATGANDALCCAPSPRPSNTSTRPAPNGPPGAPGVTEAVVRFVKLSRPARVSRLCCCLAA